MHARLEAISREQVDGVRRRRRLILDRVPPDFHPDTHLALGPWCFSGAEDVYPDWDVLAFADPFPTREDRCAAGKAVRALANALLDRLYPEMNRRHGTRRTRAYWHAVLMDWLMHLVMLNWRLWRHVELFVETSGGEPLEVAVATATPPFRFACTEDFVNACFAASELRSWLLSEIIRRRAPAHWQLRAGAQKTPAALVPRVPIRRARRAVERIGARRIWEHLLSGYVNLLPRRCARPRAVGASSTNGFPAAFLELMNQLVESSLPETLRGGFAALEAEVARHRYRRGRLCVTCINIHDDQANIEIGQAIEAGERVVAVQHGGGYGIPALLPLLAELEYGHDAFATWGWSAHEGYEGRLVPLPSPHLSSILGAYRPRDDRMLLVGALMSPFNPRCDYYPDPLPYRRRKRYFLSALPPALRAKLVYRPYHSADSLADADYLKRFFPSLVVHEGELHPDMLRARLTVLDHPSTTLCLTMAANVPTVCFWDAEAWLLGRGSQPLFDGLKQAGILFDSPQDAARHIAGIWPRLEEWWAGAEVQKARRAWCRQFALASRLWLLHWMKGLAAL
jgi:hypothetical protein